MLRKYFNKGIYLFLFAILMVFVFGCRTTSNTTVKRYFFSTTYSEISEGLNPRDNIMEKEIPVLLLYNFNGEKVKISVANLETREIVYEKLDYVPQEHTKRWYVLEGLEGGSYKAILQIEGNVVGTYTFNVSH